MQGLTSLTRDRIHTPPAVEALSLNHRTAREVPVSMYFLRDTRIKKKKLEIEKRDGQVKVF